MCSSKSQGPCSTTCLSAFGVEKSIWKTFSSTSTKVTFFWNDQAFSRDIMRPFVDFLEGCYLPYKASLACQKIGAFAFRSDLKNIHFTIS
ncbi:hypothetical protein Scep_026445 [Stephania cephalantha]|uniref:Uncharacterized protein n=1 Tax=Stephania cephalantha TaxID=152367 RepID=A0AAP0EK70_9MAGN